MCVDAIRYRASVRGGPDERNAESYAVEDRRELIEELDDTEAAYDLAEARVELLEKALKDAGAILAIKPAITTSSQIINKARRIIAKALKEEST